MLSTQGVKEMMPILGTVDSSGCPQTIGGAFIRGCTFIRHITVDSCEENLIDRRKYRRAILKGKLEGRAFLVHVK